MPTLSICDRPNTATRAWRPHLFTTVTELAEFKLITSSTPEQEAPEYDESKRVFPKFVKLPPELQQLIWSLVLPEPKIMIVRGQRKLEYAGHYSIPPTLSVCFQSRDVALRRYQPGGPGVRILTVDGPAEYLDFLLDTLYLPLPTITILSANPPGIPADAAATHPAPQRALYSIRHRVRTLAVELPSLMQPPRARAYRMTPFVERIFYELLTRIKRYIWSENKEFHLELIQLVIPERPCRPRRGNMQLLETYDRTQYLRNWSYSYKELDSLNTVLQREWASLQAKLNKVDDNDDGTSAGLVLVAKHVRLPRGLKLPRIKFVLRYFNHPLYTIDVDTDVDTD